MDSKFPEVGELVIGTCSKLTDHGAYFEIFDYEILGSEAGFVHISELSRTWVRNIRSHIREGQKAVAKILRIDEKRGEIDMSIRRVSEPQRRQKLNEFKQENRARGIVAVACEKVGISTESVEKILLSNFGSIYEGLLRAREEEAKLLIDKGVQKEAANEIHQLAIKELEPSLVELHGTIKLTCYEPDGAVRIRDFFSSYFKNFQKKHMNSKIGLQIISPPEYRCTIESEDWKKAESLWKDLQDQIIKKFKPFQAEMSFERI
ncbi:MAG: S1 RNA-binding domain-containing protein [Candidatus Heimdallarchaeota archaeon]|nr:S1 RNA-binding domain-containing protein [Candidatus Heimdallarchaeota archaeon]